MLLLKTLGTAFAGISDHHYLGRYSIEKLQLFEQYQRTTSPLRVTTVILLTPLPTLLALAAMDYVPLDDPLAGARGNTIAFVRSTISHAVMTFFTLLPIKQALALSHREYSFTTIACVACCTALSIEALCIPLAFTWRFPVPFREMIGLPVFVMGICGYSFAFAKHTIKRLWRSGQLQQIVPLVGVQITLFYLFLGMSVGFAHLSLLPQTVMILVFPIIKMLLKHLVWKYARQLSDISTDVTICMLEISGALYQTVCVQFADSPVLNVLIVLSDVLQAIHEVRTYTQVNYLTDGRKSVSTALKIVAKALAQAEKHGRRSSVLRALPLPGSTIGEAKTASYVVLPVEEIIHSLHRSIDRTTSCPSEEAVQVLTPKAPLLYAGRSVYMPPSTVRLARCAGRNRSRRLLDLDGISSGGSRGRHRQAEKDEEDPDSDPEGTTTSTATTASRTHSSAVSHHTVRSSAKQPSSRRGLYFCNGFLSLARRHSHSHLHSHSRKKIYAITADTSSTASSSSSSSAKNKTGIAHHTAQPFPLSFPASIHAPPSFLPVGQGSSSSHESQHKRKRKRQRVQSTSKAVWIDNVRIAHRNQARVLEQTLQLLFASEVLLFAEYMEVVVPLLYAAWVGSEWLSPNASYNIAVASMDGARVAQEIWTAALYALLELVSLIAMYWFMRSTYGVSALYQLAFVLEKYWMTLQGKLVGSFIVLLNALTIHQGAGGV